LKLSGKTHTNIYASTLAFQITFSNKFLLFSIFINSFYRYLCKGHGTFLRNCNRQIHWGWKYFYSGIGIEINKSKTTWDIIASYCSHINHQYIQCQPSNFHWRRIRFPSY
jgi:hypothetical protein